MFFFCHTTEGQPSVRKKFKKLFKNSEVSYIIFRISFGILSVSHTVYRNRLCSISGAEKDSVLWFGINRRGGPDRLDRPQVISEIWRVDVLLLEWNRRSWTFIPTFHSQTNNPGIFLRSTRSSSVDGFAIVLSNHVWMCGCRWIALHVPL